MHLMSPFLSLYEKKEQKKTTIAILNYILQKKLFSIIRDFSTQRNDKKKKLQKCEAKLFEFVKNVPCCVFLRLTVLRLQIFSNILKNNKIINFINIFCLINGKKIKKFLLHFRNHVSYQILKCLNLFSISSFPL